jgi:hypothetical protein
VLIAGVSQGSAKPKGQDACLLQLHFYKLPEFQRRYSRLVKLALKVLLKLVIFGDEECSTFSNKWN